MSNDAPAAEEADRTGDAPHPRTTPVLFGQEDAEAQFLEALRTRRLPHGWMISGHQGVGKATLAWRIARYLVAGGHGDTLEMSPDDPVFRQVSALSAPQVHLCRRPWDERNRRLRTAIGVDDVRALKSFFQLSATGGGWRVAIVDAADEMTVPAANALLKILEEPPQQAVLLLVCHQPSLLLPTLRSRCRVLRCRALAPQAMRDALRATGTEAEEHEAKALAALAAGSVGTAHLLLARDGVTLYEDIIRLLRGAPQLDRQHAITLAESCSGRGAEARYALVLEMIQLAISRLALAAAGKELVPVSENEAAIAARLGYVPEQARIWAECVADCNGRTGHARAVHLDPAQVILDTFLQIDQAAARAHAFAA